MNLQVNFIEPAEVRSASMVSVKYLLQMTATLVPIIMVLLLVHAYISNAEQQSKLELLSGTWETMEVRQKKSLELSQKLDLHRRPVGEIGGWQQSRLAWPELLSGIREHVPPSIQIKVLQARHTLKLGPEGIAERNLRLIINGRGTGPDAEGRVESLRHGIGTQPPLSYLVKEARVTGFREDAEAGAGPEDRTFQIEVDFIPRKLDATAAK